MRNFDPDMAAELLKETTQQFFMIQFGFSTPYYCTDLDIPVYYDGNKYLPRDFDLGDINYAAALSVDKLSVEIDNVDSQLSAMLLGEDVRNKWVTVYRGLIRPAEPPTQAQEIYVAPIFQGLLDGWEDTEPKARIDVVNEFVLWKKKTLRLAQATCPWTFKGEECAYSGAETWCDQSYERCVALGNNLGTGGVGGFGGFRFLPAISEKEIWWGRTPK